MARAKEVLKKELLDLDPADRLDLIEDLWESLSPDERDSLPLTAPQRAELDRRLDLLDREGPVGISSADLVDRIQKRSL